MFSVIFIFKHFFINRIWVMVFKKKLLKLVIVLLCSRFICNVRVYFNIRQLVKYL